MHNNSNGTVTYTPTPSFIGTDSFTYTVSDDDGEPSNQATVTVTVNNLLPTIADFTGDTPVDEGTRANFTATATNLGLDTLTYTWNFGDGSHPVIGQAVTHVFAGNSTYTTTLRVTDENGGSSSQTLSVNVNNVAPLIEVGEERTVDEGQAVTFKGSFSDPGVLDTLFSGTSVMAR